MSVNLPFYFDFLLIDSYMKQNNSTVLVNCWKFLEGRPLFVSETQCFRKSLKRGCLLTCKPKILDVVCTYSFNGKRPLANHNMPHKSQLSNRKKS